MIGETNGLLGLIVAEVIGPVSNSDPAQVVVSTPFLAPDVVSVNIDSDALAEAGIDDALGTRFSTKVDITARDASKVVLRELRAMSGTNESV